MGSTMKIKEFLKKIPLSVYITLGLALICAVIHVIAVISVPFADFFNRTVAAFFRFFLAKLSGWLPISFAEIIIITLPITVGVLLFFFVRAVKRKKGLRYAAVFFSSLTLIYSSFVLTFAVAYRGTPLDKELELERTEVTVSELKLTAEKVVSELNALADKLEYGEDYFSVMPYTFSELNAKLNSAYSKGSEKYPFIQSLKSKVKPVMLSAPMTYTHISGVYTFFTGEANVNVNYPEYNHPYTTAHEMAHQRGIAREDEANFVAYLICLESDDVYIRYSAYLNMFEYLSGALARADKEVQYEIWEMLDIRVVNELYAYSDFFDKYRDNVAADISGAVNDGYLVSQGQTSGTKSYGLVVDLAVAYYREG